VDSGRLDTGCGSGRSGGQRTLAASSSAADRTPAPRPPSSCPDGIARWPQFGSTADTAAVSAGCGSIPCGGPSYGPPPASGFRGGRCGHRGRRLASTAVARRGVHGRSVAGDRHVPACSGRRPPPAVDSGRPASTGRITSRTADTAAVSGSAATCWGSAPGPRSRRTATVRTLGQWMRPSGLLTSTASQRRLGVARRCWCDGGGQDQRYRAARWWP
jgi:hypothetical protein